MGDVVAVMTLSALAGAFALSGFTWWTRRQRLLAARERPIDIALPAVRYESYPLRIESRGHASRVVHGLLRSRVEEWARSNGFEAELADEARMRFTRGSNFLASFAFGVRYIPTTVCVDVEGDTLNWSFLTTSALQYLGGGDKEEAAHELLLFLDALGGACDLELPSANVDAAR